MPKPAWYNSDNPDRVARGFAGRAALWTVAIVVFMGAVSVVLYLFGVFASGPKGRLDQRVQQNQVGNRVFQQQHFEDLKAQYDADLGKIPLYKQAAGNDPTSQTNLVGIVSNCLETATTYNQDGMKVLATDSGGTQFKTADLPENLDPKACDR